MALNPIKERAFKVLHRDYHNDRLTSVNYSVRMSGRQVVYPTDGSLVRPAMGRLFVFNDYTWAQDFAKREATPEIWEVSAFGNEVADIRLYDSVEPMRESFETFWKWFDSKDREKYSLMIPLRNVPSGTFYCKSLRLIKRIK